jgi:hypothetical protein
MRECRDRSRSADSSQTSESTLWSRRLSIRNSFGRNSQRISTGACTGFLQTSQESSDEKLVAIAVDCGYAENTGRVASYKKAELVNSLLWYFHTARAAATPGPVQEKAREWLPDAMRFPAVNPDATAEAADETNEDAPWADAA